jgi:hypothetical protein
MFSSNPDVQKMTRDSCLKTEADYAAKLTRVWSKVPAKDREDCQKLLATAQSSSQGLAGYLGLAMAQHFLNGDVTDCK